MQIWRAVIILFLFVTTAFAVPIDLTFAVPGIAIIVIAGLAVASMIANSISNPQLEAWVKTEIRELTAGAVLIAIVMGLFAGSQGLGVALTGDSDYVGTAQKIAIKWSDSLSGAYQYIIKAATAIKIAATYSSGTSAPIYWVSLNYQTGPLSGAAIFLVPLSIATQALTNGIYLTEAISMIIVFLKVVVPKILLPMAFCARLIPFTRRTGNTLIALCIAGLVILPYSVILADFLNSQMSIPQPKINDLSALDADPFPIYAFAPVCEFKIMRFMFSLTDIGFAALSCLPVVWLPPAYAACFNYVWYVLYPIISMIFQIANSVLLLGWEAKMALESDVYGAEVFDQLQPFLAAVNNLVLVIYLDIIFIAIVTVSGAKSIASAIGGEAYMAGIQRLI